MSGGSGRRSSARRRRATMTMRRALVDAGLLGGWVCCAAAHAVFAAASRRNYPGGVAFAALHASRAGAPGLVHVDAAAAMTGVSRFGEAAAARGWAYSKETFFVDGELRRAEALKDDARTMKDASSEDEDEEASEEDEDSNEDTRASPHTGSSEGLHSSPREDDREARDDAFSPLGRRRGTPSPGARRRLGGSRSRSRRTGSRGCGSRGGAACPWGCTPRRSR